jgi:hypothetical protein
MSTTTAPWTPPLVSSKRPQQLQEQLQQAIRGRQHALSTAAARQVSQDCAGSCSSSSRSKQQLFELTAGLLGVLCKA